MKQITASPAALPGVGSGVPAPGVSAGSGRGQSSPAATGNRTEGTGGAASGSAGRPPIQADRATSASNPAVSHEGCSAREASRPAASASRKVCSFRQKGFSLIGYSPALVFSGGSGRRSFRKSRAMSNAPANTTACMIGPFVKTMNTKIQRRNLGTWCFSP